MGGLAPQKMAGNFPTIGPRCRRSAGKGADSPRRYPRRRHRVNARRAPTIGAAKAIAARPRYGGAAHGARPYTSAAVPHRTDAEEALTDPEGADRAPADVHEPPSRPADVDEEKQHDRVAGDGREREQRHDQRARVAVEIDEARPVETGSDHEQAGDGCPHGHHSAV